MLKAWLAHPLTSGLDIDDPTHLRQQIIQEKSFLRQIYQEWHRAIVTALPAVKEQCWKWEGSSGGISLRSLVPGWSFEFWRRLENAVGHWNNELALFAKIVLGVSIRLERSCGA
jgi:hypothetical protein